jgi:hypothetical protein
MPKRPRIGDIVEIPTKRGLVYAQYAHRKKQFGELLRVLPGFLTERPSDFAHLVEQPPRFVAFFPLGAAINGGIFKVIANIPVPESAQKLPLFRAPGHIDRQGRVHDWWLWDGERSWRVGRCLQPEHRSLPLQEVINDTLLIERIEEDWTPEVQAQIEDARGIGTAPSWAGLVGTVRRIFGKT